MQLTHGLTDSFTSSSTNTRTCLGHTRDMIVVLALLMLVPAAVAIPHIPGDEKCLSNLRNPIQDTVMRDRILISDKHCSQPLGGHHHEILKRQTGSYEYTGPLVPSYNISIPIDHFNQTDFRTYENQYWVNDTYYQPGGPVFFQDYGEAGITEQSAAAYLAEINGTTAIMALARQYHGLAILWEHRYFGWSRPFPFNDTGITTPSRQGAEPIGAPDSWQYLTFDQALEDVVYFAQNLASGGYQMENTTQLSPDQTPWIWVGGSYPGIRGALLRIRNPEVIYATWSSSAPVEAIADGHTYYNSALRSLPPNCSADVTTLIPYVDEIISGEHGEDARLELQRLAYVAGNLGVFGLNDTYNLSRAEAESTTYEIGAQLRSPFLDVFQSYGPNWTTRIFCDALESYRPGAPGLYANDSYINILTNPGDFAPTGAGFLASHDNNLTLGLEALWFAQRVYTSHFWDVLWPLLLEGAQAADTFLGDQSAWQYLVQTQFGWIQGSDPDNTTLLSKYVNTTSLKEQLAQLVFSNATIASLPSQVDVNSVNKYGGWNMNPSNTMFTDGEYDPWRAGSVFSLDEGAPGYMPSNVVPACGQLPGQGSRYGVLYPGAVHVPDLAGGWWIDENNGTGPDSPVNVGVEAFVRALDVWLPCFGKQGANGNLTAGQNGTGNSETPAVSRNAASVSSIVSMGLAWTCLCASILWLVV